MLHQVRVIIGWDTTSHASTNRMTHILSMCQWDCFASKTDESILDLLRHLATQISSTTNSTPHLLYLCVNHKNGTTTVPCGKPEALLPSTISLLWPLRHVHFFGFSTLTPSNRQRGATQFLEVKPDSISLIERKQHDGTYNAAISSATRNVFSLLNTLGQTK